MNRWLTGIALAVILVGCVHAGSAAVKLSTVRWDFETGDLQGWTQSGTLTKQPTNKSNDRHMGNYNKQGKFFIGTCELATSGTT